MGLGELIEDTVHGLLVPPRDPGALAGAIAKLLRDPEARHRMGARGKDRQGREFDLESMVERVELLYEELVRHESTTPVTAETSSSPADAGHSRPLRTALICSESSLVDHRLLAAQLAAGSELTGILLIRNSPRQRGARFRHEWKRSGWRLLDVLAFRVFYNLRLARPRSSLDSDQDDRGARAAAGSTERSRP